MCSVWFRDLKFMGYLLGKVIDLSNEYKVIYVPQWIFSEKPWWVVFFLNFFPEKSCENEIILFKMKINKEQKRDDRKHNGMHHLTKHGKLFWSLVLLERLQISRTDSLSHSNGWWISRTDSLRHSNSWWISRTDSSSRLQNTGLGNHHNKRDVNSLVLFWRSSIIGSADCG